MQRLTPAVVSAFGVTRVRASDVTERLASVRAPVVYPSCTRLWSGPGAWVYRNPAMP
jgi:hypothetical protein